MSEYDWILEKALPPFSGAMIAYLSLKWAFDFIGRIVPRLERIAVAIEGFRTQLAIVAGQPPDAANDRLSNEKIPLSNP